MKIAISTDGGLVSSHFGRCPTYTIVEIENGQILTREEIDNPGHQPGFLPEFLYQRGVTDIICGGMGPRAQSLFGERGINTFLGVSGKVDEVIKAFVEGKLKPGESLCRPGSGKGYGVGKSECDHTPEE